MAQAEPDLSATGLLASDAELKEKKMEEVHKRYSVVADTATIKATTTALEALGHAATVCQTKAEALELLQRIAGQHKGTYGQGGSTTLTEIGWVKWLKDNPKTFAENTKQLAVESMNKKDWAAAARYNKAGLSADIFFTSVCAITRKGEILSCDLTGTRTGALPHAAKNVVIVVGANKLVPTLLDAERRMMEYCLPMESARCRIVFASAGVKESAINNTVLINGSNPFASPKRIHVVIVNERLGF